MGKRKLTGNAAILVAAICTAAATSAFADGWVSKSISINFAGPRDSLAPGDSGFSAVSGSALFGALPVAGDNWNNFQTHASTYGSGVTSASSIKLGDGTVAAGASALPSTGGANLRNSGLPTPTVALKRAPSRRWRRWSWMQTEMI